mgnify:CR=1 FL=1
MAFYDGGKNPALSSISGTLMRVFSELKVFEAEPGEEFSDFVILASDNKLDPDKSLGNDERKWFTDRLVSVDLTDSEIITDDYNPLEYLQLRKSEAYRQMVADLLGYGLMLN